MNDFIKDELNDEISLDELIKMLPSQIKLTQFNSNLKEKKPIVYDLIIFSYRNTVAYIELELFTTCVRHKSKLIEFFDGELIDNLKKMITYLKENKVLFKS